MLLFLLLILGHLGYKDCNCANGLDDLFSIIYVFNSLTSCLLLSILYFDSANACEFQGFPPISLWNARGMVLGNC